MFDKIKFVDLVKTVKYKTKLIERKLAPCTIRIIEIDWMLLNIPKFYNF